MPTIQRISPCLWFDGQAEEAANHYVSIFPNSRIDRMMRYGEVGHGAKGSVLTVNFTLDGQEFTGLNGGPTFKFTEAISMMVAAKDQEEIDYYWDRLGAGGQYVQCGWLKDKFGLSWQVAPAELPELFSGDQASRDRVLGAVMKMVKLDLATMRAAKAG